MTVRIAYRGDENFELSSGGTWIPVTKDELIELRDALNVKFPTEIKRGDFVEAVLSAKVDEETGTYKPYVAEIETIADFQERQRLENFAKTFKECVKRGMI